MSQKLLIQGAVPRVEGNAQPPRLEIRQFVADTNIKQFSLYIQALRSMYDRPSTDVASYFQIAGIHALPDTPWNGAQGGYYCEHNSSRFGTWHRPYMALIEQEIQRLAREIALSYPSDQAAWLAAADQLRQPYWAWDKGATFLPPPQVISSEHVNIITPSSNGASIPQWNPFLGYGFQTGETSTFGKPFDEQKTTLRHPKNNISRPDQLELALLVRKSQILRDSELLHSVTSFTEFSTRLEAVHGSVHIAVGGRANFNDPTETAGHIGHVPVSAFDPIFWLHHCQVDRLLHVWSTEHDDWDSHLNSLLPFWRTQDVFWKPPNVKNLSIFNYSYGDPRFEASSEVEGTTGSVVQEWRAHAKFELFQVGGSFSTFYFLGNVPADPTQWLTDPAFAGVSDVFANDNPEQCPNCNDLRDLVISSAVYLNEAILKRVGTLDEKFVVPLLKTDLHWVVQRVLDGKIIKSSRVPSLEVTVIRTPIILATGAVHPSEGKTVTYHEITSSRDGGYKEKYEY